MPEKKKKAVVPRLRFPEFRDAGPWEVKRLGEVGKISTGKTPRTGDRELWNGEIPWITPTDIDDAKRIATSDRRLTQKGAIAAGLLPKNTVLVTCIASIGKNAILDAPGSCNQQINAIIPQDDYDADFIFYLIEKSHLAMMNLAGGSSPAIIPKSEFEKLKLPFPNLPEQQKIADCLSSLDDLIRAEEAALEALNRHKRGLMQQLFPAEGETTPRLRFPEFRDAGPWAVKRLGEVLTFQTGFPFSSKDFNETGDGIRLIRNADLKSGDRMVFYSGSYDQIFIVNNGDILVGMDGDFSPSIWRNGKALLNQRVGRVFAKDGNSLAFLHYSLSIALKVIEQRTAQTTVKHLSHATVEKTKWPIPAFPEQQKIADCLSSLDELIELQSQKVEALKQHKKGLMQQLFPQEVA